MEKRLDILVVERGLAPSRERAKDLIQGGQIKVDGKSITKASQKVEETAVLVIEGETLRYVSRGGLKLEKALEVFPIDLKGKTCLDIGASTGGFTDCMLQNGAGHVFAVDVGRDQLAEVLREDPRVTNLEQTNVRYVTEKFMEEACGGVFKGRADFASIDVSFISLTKVLDAVAALIKEEGEIVCLIKPQFEAGRGAIGKKGVVKEPSVHRDVIRMVMTYAEGIGLRVKGLSFSPIRGPEGNIEYLLHLSKAVSDAEDAMAPGLMESAENRIDLLKVVREAHHAL